MDNYTGNDIVFKYNPFSVWPAFCPVDVMCYNVTGPSSELSCQEIDANNEVRWNFEPRALAEGVEPGTYQYTYAVGAGSAALTTLFAIELVLSAMGSANNLPAIEDINVDIDLLQTESDKME